MFAKQAWRLVNNVNPLVTVVMKARYYANCEFMEAVLGTYSSYMWRSILAAKEVVKQGGRKRISDGRDTKIWQVPWLPCSKNSYVTSDLHPDLRNVTVDALMINNERRWDVEVLRDIFNNRDCQLIQSIPLSRHVERDTWYWKMEKNGDFSVKSCYRKLCGERDYGARAFWGKLWKLKLPGKVINFLWRTCLNILPTAAALAVKQVVSSQFYSWC